MLLLTRRVGERIFIMDENMKKVEICITVTNLIGGQVRLGIDADKSYTILREEVFLRNAQGNRDNEYKYDDKEDEIDGRVHYSTC